VTSNPTPHLCCFQFKMCDDAWCEYSAVMVSSVRSYCDKTVRKLFPFCVCVPCCIYIVKLFKSLHLKWLAKVLCYIATHFFRVHNSNFPDFTPFFFWSLKNVNLEIFFTSTAKLSTIQSRQQTNFSIYRDKALVWKYLLYRNDLFLHLSLHVYMLWPQSSDWLMDLWNAACLYDSTTVFLLQTHGRFLACYY